MDSIGGAGTGARTLEEMNLHMSAMGKAFLSPPEAVASAVLKSIKRDKAEIVIMPGPGRLMKALLDLFPGMGQMMNQMGGVTPLSLGTMRFLPEDYRVEMAEVNGQSAVIIRTDGQTLLVLTTEAEAEQIQAIRLIANPEKLARMLHLPMATSQGLHLITERLSYFVGPRLVELLPCQVL